jgi:hypothetical protein
MARARRVTIKKSSNPEPIWTWRTQSSQPRGGEIISYETRLEETGVIRCNCPGWVFSRGDVADKTCKHKLQYQHEAPEIIRKWKSGEVLPKLYVGGKTDAGAPIDQSVVKYGRLIEI